MARRGYVPLYKKQKSYLTELFNKHNIKSVDDMSGEQWDTLNNMHCTETLWSDANRFLSDLHFWRMRTKPW